MAERLVHCPLTALMLLDVTSVLVPEAQFEKFTYRAQNPLVVNQPVKICGAWEGGKNAVTVWAENALDGTVGMTGKITLYPSALTAA